MGKSKIGPIQRSAAFDVTGQYRYWLQREWQAIGPVVTFVMLNPSRADHQQDDPTLRRCMALAQRWQFSRLIVVNLFAYCTPSPLVLKGVAHPIGKDNDEHLRRACGAADQILLAWGNGGCLHRRDEAVLKLLQPQGDRLFCLGRNLTGQPRHPLYVPQKTCPRPWLKA